jgi:LytS/YehU family sensor histidine kinase
MQPWLCFAALVPVVVLFVRRFPLGARPLRVLPIHGLAAIAYAVLHLGLIAVVNRFRGGGPPLDVLVLLLGEYLVLDVAVYAALAATVLVLDARREARERELAAAELEAHLAEARLHALRGQLHPHFLFNALNGVSMLVRAERGAAALEVLAELGELLRAVVADQGAHEVPLADELDFNRRYLALEQVRFGDRLRVSFDSPRELERALVPNLVLQPLVENAVRHGVAKNAGAGEVRVRAFRDGERLALEVWNDGPAPGPEGTGTGLRTTRGRLASLYGDEQELSLGPGPDGGVVARVSVPFHTRPITVEAA